MSNNFTKYNITNIIGDSKIIKDSKNILKIIAKYDYTVILYGETGSGKELFAQSIHNEGKRKNNLFVARNCGAFVSGVLENELFGHEDGAFTGAAKGGKKGLFQEANGGTVFLDEVGDLPFDMQVKLLRVLQEGEIYRIGGYNSIKVDIRVICATHKDLAAEVKKGTFREDLYHRLNLFTLYVPPLRNRNEDMEILVDNILKKVTTGTNDYRVSKHVIETYKKYSWPGNIRELENILKRELAFLKSGEHVVDHVPHSILKAIQENGGRDNKQNTPDLISSPQPPIKRLVDIEKEAIIRALKYFDYNKKEVSKALGIGRNTLYRKMKNLNIKI